MWLLGVTNAELKEYHIIFTNRYLQKHLLRRINSDIFFCCNKSLEGIDFLKKVMKGLYVWYSKTLCFRPHQYYIVPEKYYWNASPDCLWLINIDVCLNKDCPNHSYKAFLFFFSIRLINNIDFGKIGTGLQDYNRSQTIQVESV